MGGAEAAAGAGAAANVRPSSLMSDTLQVNEVVVVVVFVVVITVVVVVVVGVDLIPISTPVNTSPLRRLTVSTKQMTTTTVTMMMRSMMTSPTLC